MYLKLYNKNALFILSLSLFDSLKIALHSNGIEYQKSPAYREFRAGDVRHSQADISKAKSMIGFEPEYKIQQGIDKAMPWYVDFLSKNH